MKQQERAYKQEKENGPGEGGATLKKHRIFIVLMGISVVLVGWNLRLLWIQALTVHSFAGRGIDLVENSVLQREKGIVLDSGRGDFLDRHLQPLTGRELQVLTVFPVKQEVSGPSAAGSGPESAGGYNQVAGIMGIPLPEWQAFLGALKSPQIWSTPEGRPVPLSDSQASRIEALGLGGVRVMPYKQRYLWPQPGGQVIGYVGQNPERVTKQFTDQFHKGELQLTSKIGNAGLEKTFEPWLQGIGPTSVSLFTDGGKRPLPGLDARSVRPANPYYPLQVVTTLDTAVQADIEKRMDKLGVREGAVVVLDAEQADTIAMASRPAFHPEHVDLQSGGWSNRALKATAPGSIFKTITAAAALEEGVVKLGETFDCRGELGRFGFTCWKKEGHGRLTLEEGFADSCNIVFAKVAERLGSEKLERYAKRLGLTVPVGWTGNIPQHAAFRQWDGEEQGQVYTASSDRSDPGALVQTSIGQRDVQVSPLQAANLIVTLLHGGQVLSPRVVQEIRFRGGRLYEAFGARELEPKPAPAIHAATAKRLLGWMKEVVAHGTGTPLQNANWPVAGKSGTAQVTLKNGRPGENQWFIGYGPADHPRYAVAVLVSGVPAGQKNTSLPLFREVMNVLSEHDTGSQPADAKS